MLLHTRNTVMQVHAKKEYRKRKRMSLTKNWITNFIDYIKQSPIHFLIMDEILRRLCLNRVKPFKSPRPELLHKSILFSGFFECKHSFIEKPIITTEPAVPSSQLLGLGSKLYASSIQCMLIKDFTWCKQSLSRVRQHHTSNRKALLEGWKEVEMKKRNPWLPLTVMETLGLSELPKELFATHLYIDSPLFDSVLTHILLLLSPTSVLFRNNWYEVTSGLASPTEQVSFKISFWHALFALAFVVSWTFSGLTIRKKHVYINVTKFNQQLMWHDS